MYENGAQVAFARAITDGVTFAWIADVFVVRSHRRRGPGRRLIEAVLAHPEIRGSRNVLLATADAHGLYARYGFAPLARPDRYLSLRGPGPGPSRPRRGGPSRDPAAQTAGPFRDAVGYGPASGALGPAASAWGADASTARLAPSRARGTRGMTPSLEKTCGGWDPGMTITPSSGSPSQAA